MPNCARMVRPRAKSVTWVARAAMDRVIAWEDAMDYSSGDYALDQIAGLEKQISELREELHRALPRS